jgi:hypothetical protein
MNKGRQLLYKLSQAQPALPAQQRLVMASKVAVATVWDMLHDFVGVGMCPPAWLLEVGPGHPFLHVVHDAHGEACLQVNRPQHHLQQQ